MALVEWFPTIFERQREKDHGPRLHHIVRLGGTRASRALEIFTTTICHPAVRPVASRAVARVQKANSLQHANVGIV